MCLPLYLPKSAALQINVEWMHENDIVKKLLRANLHQKQYVDQVEIIPLFCPFWYVASILSPCSNSNCLFVLQYDFQVYFHQSFCPAGPKSS